MKSYVPFHLLHHLVNMSIEHGHRSKPLQVRQGPLAVVCSPSPVRINRPQRNVREDHDRRAARQPLDVALQPFELLVTERSQSTRLQIHDVHQADEVNTVLIEAVPPRTECSLSEAIEITPSVVFEHVVFAWYIEDRERQLGQDLLKR